MAAILEGDAGRRCTAIGGHEDDWPTRPRACIDATRSATRRCSATLRRWLPRIVDKVLGKWPGGHRTDGVEGREKTGGQGRDWTADTRIFRSIPGNR